MSNSEATKVIIQEVELNYVHLLKPAAGPNGGEPKYSVQIRIKKDAHNVKEVMGQIKTAFTAAYNSAIQSSKWGQKKVELNALLKAFVHDGDAKAAETDDHSYDNTWFFNANSKTAPEVIDEHGVHLTDPGHEKDVYSGMIGAVSVNFYAYAGAKNGIACGLNNVLKTAEGSYAGGRASAKSDFQGLIQEAAPASEAQSDAKADSNSVDVSDDDLPF